MARAVAGVREAVVSPASRNVVLVGNFGAVNLGDEILLSTVARWVAEHGDTAIAVSTVPEHTRAAHGIETAFYADPAALVEAIADADLVVLAGGGLFQDYDELDPDALERFPAFGVTQFAQYVYLAEALGVPCIALAQGVGPLRSEGARSIVADVFSRLDACSVRDPDSAALLFRIGVPRVPMVAPDPAWAWTPRSTPSFAMPAELAGRKVLAVNVRDWAFAPGWEDALAAALAPALSSEWGCLWLDFAVPPPGASVERDAAAHRVVDAMARLGNASAHAYWSGTTADEALAALAACDAAVAMRMHAALLALRARLVTVTLEYDAKVATLADDTAVADWQRVPIAEIATRLPPALSRAMGGDASVVRMTNEALEHQRLAALAHRELLHSALARLPPRELQAHGGKIAWFSTWFPQDDSPQRIVRALAQKAGRMRDRDAAARAAIEHGATQLREANAERDAEAHARAASQAAHAQSTAHLDAILRSRSYRATAPLRRLSQWRARLASRTKK